MAFIRLVIAVFISGSSSLCAASTNSFLAVQRLFSPKSLANLLLRFSRMRKYLGRTQTKFSGYFLLLSRSTTTSWMRLNCWLAFFIAYIFKFNFHLTHT